MKFRTKSPTTSGCSASSPEHDIDNEMQYVPRRQNKLIEYNVVNMNSCRNPPELVSRGRSGSRSRLCYRKKLPSCETWAKANSLTFWHQVRFLLIQKICDIDLWKCVIYVRYRTITTILQWSTHPTSSLLLLFVGSKKYTHTHRKLADAWSRK